MCLQLNIGQSLYDKSRIEFFQKYSLKIAIQSQSKRLLKSIFGVLYHLYEVKSDATFNEISGAIHTGLFFRKEKMVQHFLLKSYKHQIWPKHVHLRFLSAIKRLKLSNSQGKEMKKLKE